jgi:site-specific DNA-methyltransferase (adenine-specific)
VSVARFLVGDVFDRLAQLPDGSVDLVMTSPPFLALRSYLPPDHPEKGREIGSEATPTAFLDTLLALTAEWRRVLAPHGSICVELGDTYSGSGGAGGDYDDGGLRDGQNRFKAKRKPGGWPLPKSLCGIPHLYHLSLAYGRNLLTGDPSPAGQWRVRNVVAWCRPNPPVGALGDKYRPATSYMTIATPSRERYFDLDAVRVPASPNTNARTAKGVDRRDNTNPKANSGGNNNRDTLGIEHLHETRPPYDWWEIPTQPYKGSHYATWPPDLCVIPIKSMVPERVCTTCGEPSRRIVEVTHEANRSTNGPQSVERAHLDGGSAGYEQRADRVAETVGWTDCGHGTWRRGVVLDPFGGSGTTLAVATGLGRDAIGIDIDARNAVLAEKRVGMFLTVEHHEPSEVVA